jgi:MFS family permease
MGKKDKRWYLWLPSAALLIAIPFTIATLFSGNTLIALVALAMPVFLISMYLPPCLALTHGIVGVRMRALASAILFFVINIIGLGCGPFLTGILSDVWYPSMGEESIRWALSTSLLANVLGAFFYFKSAETIEESMKIEE